MIRLFIEVCVSLKGVNPEIWYVANVLNGLAKLSITQEVGNFWVIIMDRHAFS